MNRFAGIAATVLILARPVTAVPAPAGLALIPAGSFEMGDHHGFVDPRHGSDETPVHPVRLDAFFMGIYDVTTAEYCAYLNAALAQRQIEVRQGGVYPVGGAALLAETRVMPAAAPRGRRPRAQPPESTHRAQRAQEPMLPHTGRFKLGSPAVATDGTLPADYTGDGEAATLPLTWSGAPAGTQSYAVIMHHLDPEGVIKWYWVLYDVPATLPGLPRNVHGVGTLGTNSINDRVGYAPPHSKGPGAKTYTVTVYALSVPPPLRVPPRPVDRDALLLAMQDVVLDTAELPVVYTRPAGATHDRSPARDNPPFPRTSR